jgi:hypothetical protein
MAACYNSHADTAFPMPSTFPAEDGAKQLLVDATTGFYAYLATYLFHVTCALPSAVNSYFHDVQTIFSGPRSCDYDR